MLLFRPFSGQSCSWALALCDRFGDGGVDGLLVFYHIRSHRRFPHPPEKTLGPIAAFAGKLSSFDVAANHEAEIYPDTGRGSRRLCAVRICLP